MILHQTKYQELLNNIKIFENKIKSCVSQDGRHLRYMDNGKFTIIEIMENNYQCNASKCCSTITKKTG